MDISENSLSETQLLRKLNQVRDSNLLLYSEDFSNVTWKNYLGTKTLSSTFILNPLSSSYAQSISGSSSVFQDTEKFNSENLFGKQFTFSVYAHTQSKASYIQPTIWFVEANSSASARFDPKTGKVLSTEGKTPLDFCGSEYVGNGWYRYYISTTPLSSVDTSIRTEIYYNTPTLNASPWMNNIILWGAQLQKGNFSKNYYKTIDAQKPSLIEEGFVSLECTEPALGLPYVKNLLTYSQNYSSAVWNTNQLTLTANVSAFYSPASSLDVYKIIPTAVNQFHYLSRSLTIPQTGIPYTFSTHFREDKNTLNAYRYAALKLKTSNSHSSLSAMINLDNGTLQQYGVENVELSSISITSAFSGWYRLSITGQYQFYNNLICEIYCGQFANTNLSFAGNLSNHIYIWGSQFEKGTQTSDYIKTSAAQLDDISYTNVWSSTDPTSAYYFLLGANTPNQNYPNSRRYTGNDSLFLSGNNLSYNHKSPTYNFEISGNFHTLSAYFDTLSTNYFLGSTLKFTDFDFVEFNSKVTGNQNWYINYLSADNVFVTSLCSTSTRFIEISVPSICANDVFSSITWNVTAGGYVSAYNVIVKNDLITPYVSAFNSFFHNLSTDHFTIVNRVCSLSSLSAENIYGFVQIDKTSPLYYDGTLLSTRLSSVYFLGIKPSDSYATDNITIVRSLTGSWDGSNGSIVETYPVLKPYFKNIRQALDYASYQGLYGEELNILIYDDISQNNINIDSNISNEGCVTVGNIAARYVVDANIPFFLKNAGLREGNYIWNKDNSSPTDGNVSYWSIPQLNFEDLNFYGMYEIGTITRLDSKKLYTTEKPFNYSPRKISFRTYVCNDKSITEGNYGANPDNWTKLSLTSKVYNRPISVNSGHTDVTFNNLCFEFDGNCTDSTCIIVYSGKVYLKNITVAALGSSSYSYGVVLANRSTPQIYVCGKTQIDPYLLTPSRWQTAWTALSGAESQSYYPGYGLAIVGNPITQNNPTWFPLGVIRTSNKGKIFIMDYKVNRRIGRFSYLNSSIILDGKFSTGYFYYLGDSCKIYSNNHIFKTNNFSLSNFENSFYANDGSTVNNFYGYNRDNFYYVWYGENFATFSPHYFSINKWIFNDSNDLESPNIDFNTNFTAKFISSENNNYLFDTQTKTINLSGSLYDIFKKNSLKEALPLNDNILLYDYVDPSNLPLYDTSGLYNLNSPIDPSFNYTLNYYSSGSQTII